MKPASLGIPSRDLGLSALRPFGEALLTRLETYEQRIAELEERLYGRQRTIRPAMSAERALLDRLDSRTADAVTLERSRIRDRAADEVYYLVPVAAGLALYTGAVTEVMNGTVIVMRYPTAADTTASVVVPARALWVGCRPRIYVWYTSPGGAGTFSFRFAMRSFGVGATTTTTTYTVDWSAAEPGVANTVLTTSAVITSSRLVSAPFGVCRPSLQRRGTVDLNGNALDVLLAVVTFEEIA